MGRERLRNSQGSSSDFPRIEPDVILTVKTLDDGQTVFQYYKDEKNVNVVKPIAGIYIGGVFHLTSFCESLGKNGNNYFSDYYLTNKRIALFKPGGGMVVKGSLEEIEHYLLAVGSKSVKKRRVIFLIVEKVGLVAVETNITISIDQFRTFEKGTFVDNMMVLSPHVWYEGDPNVSKKAIEVMGKFIKKNKPNYALIEKGDPITDEYYDLLDGDAYVDQFEKWKEFALSLIEPAGEEAPANTATAPEKPFKSTEDPGPNVSDAPGKIEEEGDDLPFIITILLAVGTLLPYLF